MGNSAGKKHDAELSRLKAEAAAASHKAAAVDPFEQRQRDIVGAWDDWRSGKNGPVDVRNMPDQIGMSLFADAKRARDEGRIGRGLATMESGTNPAFATALNKEMGLERDLAAVAGLDNYVTGKLSDIDSRMMGLAGSSTERALRLAGMADSRYGQMLQRPRPESFLKAVALGGIQAGSQLAAKAFL